MVEMLTTSVRNILIGLMFNLKNLYSTENLGDTYDCQLTFHTILMTQLVRPIPSHEQLRQISTVSVRMHL